MVTSTSTPVGAGTRRLVSFRDDVVVEPRGTDVVIAHRWGTHVVRDASRGLAGALDRLTFGPTRPANVVDLVTTGALEPRAAANRLHGLLDRLQYLLVHSVELDSSTVAELVPMATGARLGGLLGARPRSDADRVALSRFAYLHQVDGVMTLESPLSLYRARLSDPRLVALVGTAATEHTVGQLVATVDRGRARAARAVLDLLIAAGLLEPREPAAATDPKTQARLNRLRQWGFHDLLFHTRSRPGRHDEDCGATFHFLGDLEHEPPVRELPSGPRLRLPVPDLDRVLAVDPQLTIAIEGRRSVRRPGDRPLDAGQLGELLYRCARVRGVHGPDPARQQPYRTVDKPYPGCGGAGELDFWLTVSRCAGIAPGNYYYDPAGHQLVLANSDQSDVEAMLGVASAAAGDVPPPDVLVTMTARFQRLGWQYSGIPYATTLKHVGVAYQTLYLVCTAMGLAPCGLALGDTELSSRCLRLDWERESSVGEFMISGSGEPAGPPLPRRGDVSR